MIQSIPQSRPSGPICCEPLNSLNSGQSLSLAQQALAEIAVHGTATSLQIGQAKHLTYLIGCHHRHFDMHGLSHLPLSHPFLAGAKTETYLSQIIRIRDHALKTTTAAMKREFDQEIAAWAALHLP